MTLKHGRGAVCAHKENEREEIRRTIQWEMYFEADAIEPSYEGKIYPFLSGDVGLVAIPASILNGEPGELNTVFNIYTNRRSEVISEGVSGASSRTDVGYNTSNLGRIVKRDGNFLVLEAIIDD